MNRIYLCAILLFVYSMTAYSSEYDTNDLFLKGKELFEAGDFEKAHSIFMKLFKDDPGNMDVNFYLGRAAFEMGNFEGAAMTFERILIMQPDVVRVKLELALSYLKLGSNKLARHYFHEVLAENPPEAVRENILRFIAVIDRSEQRHFFNGSISLGVNWDDNVYVSPSKSDYILDYGTVTFDTPKSDYVYNMTNTLNHIYKFEPIGFSWNTTGITYNDFYHDEHDLNVLFAGISSGPSFQTNKIMVEIYGLFNHMEIDGDRYLKAMGGGSSINCILDRHWVFGLTGKIEEREFIQDSDKNSTNLHFSSGPVFISGRNRINAIFSFEKEDAKKHYNSYDRYGVSCRYSALLPFNFSMYADWRYRGTHYKEENPRIALLSDKKRKDNIHYLSTGLSDTVWQSYDRRFSLNAQISYTYTHADSNIGIYKFDKQVIATSFVFGF